MNPAKSLQSHRWAETIISCSDDDCVRCVIRKLRCTVKGYATVVGGELSLNLADYACATP